jgi:hypothetical protein
MNPEFYQLSKINKIDDDNDHSDQDETVFDDNDEEFIEFKNNVKEWLTLDDDIITLQKAIKERKNKKTELTPKVLDYMGRFNINDLNTNNGKIKFTKSMCTKPLNKQFLVSRLGDFFKDFSKGEKAASFILENRDKEEKIKLRRVVNKNELSI